MNRRNILVILGMILLGAAIVAANLWYKKETGLVVATEVIKARDLEAIVSASGKIQPKRLVNISAQTPGRVTELAVNEGDRVKIRALELDIARARSQQGRRGNLRRVCPTAMSERVNLSLRASKKRQNSTKQISIFIEFNIEHSFVNLVFC